MKGVKQVTRPMRTRGGSALSQSTTIDGVVPFQVQGLENIEQQGKFAILVAAIVGPRFLDLALQLGQPVACRQDRRRGEHDEPKACGRMVIGRKTCRG